jgi:hypothetical protein
MFTFFSILLMDVLGKLAGNHNATRLRS